MANEVMSLLDMAKLNGTDSTQGVLELNNVTTPEIQAITGRSINGREFSLPIRVAKPPASFRDANEGFENGKSEYDFYSVGCRLAGYSLKVDASVAKIHPYGKESFLADEEAGAGSSLNETLSSQVYYGSEAGTKGFMGYQEFLTDETGDSMSELTVDAGGTNASQLLTSAYLVHIGTDGVQWVFGDNGSFADSEEWQHGPVPDANGDLYNAYQKSLEFWIGLKLAPYSVARIANIRTDGQAAQLTDFNIADAIRKFPRGFKPNAIFCSKAAKWTLQMSRSAQSTGGHDKHRIGIGETALAPEPTNSNGLPIFETDGLVDTEALAVLS